MPLHNQFNRNARQNQAAEALLKKLDVGTLPSRRDLSFVMARAGEKAPEKQTINWQSNQSNFQLQVYCAGSQETTWKLLAMDNEKPVVKWTVTSEDPEYIYRLILKKGTPSENVTVEEKEPQLGSDIVKGALFLNRYKIIDFIARGGMGQIFHARDITMDREVALKVLHAHLLDDPASKLRFEREMTSCLNLRHPNIVSVSDYGCAASGTPYMVMEYIAGETLEERLKEHGPLSPNDFLPIMSQICSALHHAHEKQIIHRDIKPSNIMLVKQSDGGYVAKVVDFGIAKTVGHNSGVTKTGEVIGTLFYMSPEQCQNEPLDQRSDIYSLGVLMYETLSGIKPFKADTPMATMMLQLYKDPAPFAQVGCSIPDALEAIIFKALAKERPDRFQTLTELANALAQFRSSMIANTEMAQAVAVQTEQVQAKAKSDTSGMSLALQLLVAAELVSKTDAQAVMIFKNMHGGNEQTYLAELSNIDEQTYGLAVDCGKFMHDFQLNLEEASLTLRFCKSTGKTLEQALSEMI